MDNDPTLPCTLRASKLKMLGLLILSAAFTALGLWMASEAPLTGYLCAGFFGLGLLVFAVQLLPKSSYLHLAQDGFTFAALFGSQTVRWRDVESFSVVRIGHNDMVAWDFAPHYKRQPRGRAVSRGIAGVEAALPDTYGMKAQALANLMNRLRVRHGLAGEEQPDDGHG